MKINDAIETLKILRPTESWKTLVQAGNHFVFRDDKAGNEYLNRARIFAFDLLMNNELAIPYEICVFHFLQGTHHSAILTWTDGKDFRGRGLRLAPDARDNQVSFFFENSKGFLFGYKTDPGSSWDEHNERDLLELQTLAKRFSYYALACFGVLNVRHAEFKTWVPSEKLNIARARRGKTPLTQWHECVIAPKASSPKEPAGTIGPQPFHWRRGHQRRNRRGEWVQIKSYQAGDIRIGLSMKHYRISESQIQNLKDNVEIAEKQKIEALKPFVKALARDAAREEYEKEKGKKK